MEVLLASAERMERTGELLGQVKALEQFVHGEGLDAVAEHERTLAALKEEHLKQMEAVAGWDEAVERVLAAYQQAVHTTSAQLLRCEAIVVQLEKAATQ